uniref:Anf/Hesx1 n=1 Tax=Lampetra fluviatilis TaxID=7748 RepID=A0A1S5RP24_LAMFL|nr:Anf/Hesx1 [Lampetra fluviatilis]
MASDSSRGARVRSGGHDRGGGCPVASRARSSPAEWGAVAPLIREAHQEHDHHDHHQHHHHRHHHHRRHRDSAPTRRSRSSFSIASILGLVDTEEVEVEEVDEGERRRGGGRPPSIASTGTPQGGGGGEQSPSPHPPPPPPPPPAAAAASSRRDADRHEAPDAERARGRRSEVAPSRVGGPGGPGGPWGPPPGEKESWYRSRRPRTSFKKSQLLLLEHVFRAAPYPGIELAQSLSRRVGVDEDRVLVWFQNRRARMRRAYRESQLRAVATALAGGSAPTP